MAAKKNEALVSPLSCPRCGCPQSKVIASRRMNRAAEPQPLPALMRTRQCDVCSRQFRTQETHAPVELRSTVWRVRIGDQVFHEPLPEGEYRGLWTRYEVTLVIGEITYTLDSRNDMLAEDYPCRITVSPQGVTLESAT